MKYKEKYILNNPLPYVFFIFILSAVTYEMFSYNKLQAIVIACSFFLLLYFYKSIAITFVMVLFFIVAVVNNYLYYSFIPEKTEKIRIENVSTYYIEGNIKGRKIIINVNDAGVKKGDRILAVGAFERKSNITRGIIGNYEVKEFKVLPSDFISKLYRRREVIFKEIEKKLGTRKAGLITSVAFGYSDRLDQEDKAEMKSLGITHAISVSGLHMVLIFGVLKNILGTFVGLIISFLYVIFTGAASSAVRSFIMIAIMSSSLFFKRNYNSLAALSLSGIILLIVKPYDVFSLGFILSFLATLGIILFNKKINKTLYKLPKYLRTTISMSISTQILTLPIILLVFNEFSINFLAGNLIMLPLLNILLILGNLTIIFIKMKFMFNYILYLCHYCIWVIDLIIDYFWRINMNTLYFNYTIIYMYLAFLITYYFYKKGIKRFIYFPIIMMIYIFILIYSPFPTVRYFREGAILISYKGERVMLQTKSVIDKPKLKSIGMVNKIYSDIKCIRLSNILIKKGSKNYILNIEGREYLLLVNYEKRSRDYDIIDFRNGDLQEFWVFNQRIIARK